jgi:hypothetical protein
VPVQERICPPKQVAAVSTAQGAQPGAGVLTHDIARHGSANGWPRRSQPARSTPPLHVSLPGVQALQATARTLQPSGQVVRTGAPPMHSTSSSISQRGNAPAPHTPASSGTAASLEPSITKPLRSRHAPAGAASAASSATVRARW